MELPYSGTAARNAHYSFRPPVPGVNPEHEHPDPDPDPFQPVMEGVQAAPYDVWTPEDIPTHTEMQDRPVDHWAHLQPPVESAVPGEVAGIATTVRMVHNHAQVDYRPDSYPNYKHATQGRTYRFVPGREPWQAGESVADTMAYLVMGKNAYDQTQAPNEVYGGDAVNVGRYRLGYSTEDFGHYDFPQKQGQDGELRAYTGLSPAFPVDKPRLEDTAPYTPNSRGTDRYLTPAFNIPSMFALPGETSATDYEASATEAYWEGAAGFLEEERL